MSISLRKTRDYGDDALFIRMADFEEYCGGDCIFMQWLSEVDNILMESIGLGVFDIADKPWRRAFDDHQEPHEAVGYQVEISHDLF
jgi:hypothetical protein